ncbi:FxsA family protein [Neptuniibacter halophilus]|uniref:FxsA family protein n=1 Tax=Neptuniibacter halophilus TaxID=651666 RepID=UPI0025735019|nr:FxsA family protein [Neptuniibacter halophilus]
MKFLFLLFIIVPIIEITVLINVGEAIGAWNTVGLVLLSAFIGVNMLRYQGLSTLARAQQRASQGEIPGQEMVEGIVLAVGGALLVTPGFVTDVIGFSCLLPYTRKAFAKGLMSRFTVIASQQQGQGAQFYSHEEFHNSGFERRPPHQRDPRVQGGDVIDGEYERKD